MEELSWFLSVAFFHVKISAETFLLSMLGFFFCRENSGLGVFCSRPLPIDGIPLGNHTYTWNFSPPWHNRLVIYNSTSPLPALHCKQPHVTHPLLPFLAVTDTLTARDTPSLGDTGLI